MEKLILGLCGHAGTGKDTAADYICEQYGFVKLGWADELKRFCRRIFGFRTDQLWGPSELRGVPDERFRTAAAWDEVFTEIGTFGPEWAKSLVPSVRAGAAVIALCKWVSDLRFKYGPCGELTNRGYFIFSPRIALQTLGTEWGRAVEPDMWVRKAIRDAQLLIRPDKVWGCGENRYWYDAKHRGVSKTLKDYHYAGVVISDCRFTNEVMAISEAGGQVVRLLRGVGPSVAAGVEHHASEDEQDSIDNSKFAQVIEVAEGIPAFQKQIDALMWRIQESK